MKIKTKLKLIIISIIALLIGIISVNLLLKIQIEKKNNQSAFVDKLSFAIFQSNQIRDQYFIYRSERSKQQWFILSPRITGQFGEMSAKFTDNDERMDIEKIINMYENIANLFNQLIGHDQDVSNNDSTGNELRERIISQMMGISHLLYLEISKLSETVNKKVDKQIVRYNMFAAIAFGLLGLIIIYFSGMLIRRVTYPLLELKESTKIVARGNLDHRINVASSDEIGELAHDFDVMTEKLQAVTVSRDELNKEIQERKRIEEALKESELKYRELFERMSSAVAVYEAVDDGEDFVFRDFNAAGESIEQVNREDIIGKRVTEVFPGVKDFGVFTVFQRVWKTGKLEYFPESLYKDQRDTGTWRESWVYKLPDGDIVAVYNDITDRKQAEKTLNESEARFRAISASAHDAIIMMDNDGIITYWNEAAKRIFGYTLDEAIGKELHAFLVPRKYYKSYIKGLGHFKKTGEGNAIGKNLELSAIRKDGTEFPVELSLSAAYIQNRWSAIGILRDITERKSMEQKLHAMSLTDELTGLYNRRGFITLSEQQLKVAERTKKNILLFFADLDKMKHINDTLGHQEGDKALIDIATILKEVFRESDIIGRMGGDEFAILAIDTTDETRDVLMKRLHNTLDDYNKPEKNYQLSLSMGIAHYNPETPSTLDELMAQADTLMYEDKRNKQY